MAFHEPCFILLSKAIYYSLHGKVPADLSEGESFTGEGDEALGFVSKTALYAAMKKLHDVEAYDHCLSKVDYMELRIAVKEQYWVCSRGEEVSSSLCLIVLGGMIQTSKTVAEMLQAWVSNPLTSDNLTTFFTTTAQTLGLNSAPTTNSSTSTFTTPQNPLTKFPKELISEILLYLPLPFLKSFVLSGLLPFNLSQNNAFWHRKSILDFPFLYDFPVLEGERNWHSIYQELHRQCYATTPSKDDLDDRDLTLVLGLANRRRVWGICDQIVGEYIECLNELEDGGGEVGKEIAEKSLSLSIPIVGNPLPNDGRHISAYFVSSWDELGEGLGLGFFFKQQGDMEMLCGVEVQGKKVFGIQSEKREDVVVKGGVWVEALVLVVSGGSENCLGSASIGITGLEVILDDEQSIKVGSQTGDKRLLKVNDGMVSTGLIGELGVSYSPSLSRTFEANKVLTEWYHHTSRSSSSSESSFSQ